jgi:hypothetical protein
LENNILPTLTRIGFDESLARALFEIAPCSWQLMGPVNEKTVLFHPKINREIEEIRRGILLKARNRYEPRPWYAGSQSPQTLLVVQNHMAPENLFNLLDEVVTPWIILPRAFAFLKKQHCLYLPAYLKTINLETNEECLRIFIRITVEFVANFSLKFPDHRYPPDQLAKLLFYGYSAMFWKTLRCPPQGMENSAVFENFLNWIKILGRHANFIDSDVKETIGEMQKISALVFPGKTRIQPGCSRTDKGVLFLVTLRHGCLGIKSVLKYLGIDPLLKNRLSSSSFPNAPMLNALQCLLHAIKTNYCLESIRTQQNIRKFTSHLESAYAVMQCSFNQVENELLKRRFQVIQKMFRSC